MLLLHLVSVSGAMSCVMCFDPTSLCSSGLLVSNCSLSPSRSSDKESCREATGDGGRGGGGEGVGDNGGASGG